MDLIQIDEIHAQPPQRVLAAFNDVLAAEPFLVGTLAHHAAYFGGDDDFIARGHLVEIHGR